MSAIKNKKNIKIPFSPKVPESRPRNNPAESAGRLMVTDVPKVGLGATVGEVREMLAKQTADFNTINYIYIIDESGRFAGVISIKELFRSPAGAKVADLSPRRLVMVRARTDQERVVQLALNNSLKAVPVVNKDQVFLGVVPSDVILEIMQGEYSEDILRMAGVVPLPAHDNIFNMSLWQSLKHRAPWLVVGLMGGIFAAGIIGRFEELIARNVILASFIPLVVYMADAVGAQMEAFIIRDLAINPGLRFAKYFAKQAAVVITAGLGLSFLLYGVSWLVFGQPLVSLILSVALFSAVLTSLMVGLSIPFLLSRLKFDPANASGPIATIIQDVLSVSAYFLIASWIL